MGIKQALLAGRGLQLGTLITKVTTAKSAHQQPSDGSNV